MGENIIVKIFIADLCEYCDYDAYNGILTEKELSHEEEFRKVVVASGVCLDLENGERYYPLTIEDGIICSTVNANTKYIKDLTVPLNVCEEELIQGINIFNGYVDLMNEYKQKKLIPFPKRVLYKNE